MGHVVDGDASVVIVHHLDRLARTLTVQEAALAVLWRSGVEVIAGGEVVVADDPSDPMRTMLRQIMGAVAEYERRHVILKLHSGRKAKRRSKPTGYIGGHTVPAGCAVVDGEIVARDATVQEAALIRQLRANGANWTAIGRELGGIQGVQVQRRLATAERLGY
jgi:DNA invertase Pin-like site-specific DNA recombinase